MRILLVHGIAQNGKNPENLKKIWINTLSEGLLSLGKQLPEDISFDFPFYGDELEKYKQSTALPNTEDIITKGVGQNREYEEFLQSALNEMYVKVQLNDSDIEAEMGGAEAREKGPQNWAWVQAIARAIDKQFTDTSGFVIQNFLRDVYLYTNSPTVTKSINAIIERELTNEPTIVIGHSLGSVVAYNVLKDNEGVFNLCKFITVGSPLGIKAISSQLGIPENYANEGWYNAYDERDIVALNPLDNTYFPTDPPIYNNNGVHNQTKNRHGIKGYLNNTDIAQEILNACSTI